MRRQKRRHDFENTQVTPAANTFVQRKLTVGAVNDPLEYEADNMADKVMRMPETPFAQRKSANADDGYYDDEHIRLKPVTAQTSAPTNANSINGVKAGNALSGKINATRGAGDQLSGNTKSFMESRFGQDLSDVRIHTGSDAAQMSGALKAQAFTVGNDIYFNDGKYNPEAFDGKRLLAHELAHVMQQNSNDQTAIRRYAEEEVEVEDDVDDEEIEDPTAPGGTRYVPGPNNHSLRAQFARAAEADEKERAIYEAEILYATLQRGGRAPDFVTVDGKQEAMGSYGNITYRNRTMHILDAIEYEIGKATTVEQIQRVMRKYIPENSPQSPDFDPSMPIMIPINFDFIFPTDFDPGAIQRKKVFTVAVRKRIAELPALAPAEKIAVTTDAESEVAGMNKKAKPGYYPICWPIQLGPPSQLYFERTKAERDEDEAKQARMQLQWRQFRDPSFDPTRFHVHHINPLFLGGVDDLNFNGTTLQKNLHLRGHDILRYQPQMLFPPAGLAPLRPDLYKHSPGTKYQLVGFKASASDLCQAL